MGVVFRLVSDEMGERTEMAKWVFFFVLFDVQFL